MAGHSQFKNIMHRKGRQDAARSKIFSKLAREITVAAKMGMPDPAMNPRLRLAIQNAKAESMPKDNIQRAINKASGGDGENYEEVRYEGYGPGGIAVIVEALTDNRNRTASNVRAAFTKAAADLKDNDCMTSCDSDVCVSAIQTILMGHDTCGEGEVPIEVEKALHDYEEICEANLCNTSSGPVDIFQETCEEEGDHKEEGKKEEGKDDHDHEDDHDHDHDHEGEEKEASSDDG